MPTGADTWVTRLGAMAPTIEIGTSGAVRIEENIVNETMPSGDSASGYEPSPAEWVRRQVETIESSGGTQGTTMRGMPVVVLTMRGAKSGKLRKVPLMRVEHEGRYAAVASLGGAPKHPVWYFNLKADPRVDVQDGPVVRSMVAREVSGDEKAQWWERSVAAFSDYADYQAKTDREIPLFLLEPAEGTDG